MHHAFVLVSHGIARRAIAALLVTAAYACADDLPMNTLPPDEETGSKTEGQKETDEKPAGDDKKESAAGDQAVGTAGRTGRAGTSGTSGGDAAAGSTARGGTGGGGAGGSDPGSAMSAGSGGRMAGGGTAGSSPMMPAGPVVAACMGRSGETVCDGAALIKCGEAGTAKSMERCMNAAQCRAGIEAGACGTCDPGVVQCMGAELRECSMTGEFMFKETCASEALCNEAMKACDKPGCQADEYKCDSGALLKCKEDLTDFAIEVPSCPVELCDQAGKKCNMCVPGSKECAGSMLRTCATDGSGYTDTKCAAPTDQCVEGRCVECTEDAECMPQSQCQQATCNKEMGKCSTPTPKTVGTECSENGGKKCSLAGTCVVCNTDLDCNPSQRCSVVFGCVERQALVPGISIIAGVQYVTLNAGWGLKSKNPNELGTVTYSAGFLQGGGTVPTSGEGDLLQPVSQNARTVTFNGPAGKTCQILPVSDTQLTLQFSTPSTDETNPASCNQSVTIYATKGD